MSPPPVQAHAYKTHQGLIGVGEANTSSTSVRAEDDAIGCYLTACVGFICLCWDYMQTPCSVVCRLRDSRVLGASSGSLASKLRDTDTTGCHPTAGQCDVSFDRPTLVSLTNIASESRALGLRSCLVAWLLGRKTPSSKPYRRVCWRQPLLGNE